MPRAITLVLMFAATSLAGAYRVAVQDASDSLLAVERQAQTPHAAEGCWQDLRVVARDAVRPFRRYSEEITGFCQSTHEALQFAGVRSLPMVHALTEQCSAWTSYAERPPSSELRQVCDLPLNATDGHLPSSEPPSESSAADCWSVLASDHIRCNSSLDALETFCEQCSRWYTQRLIHQSVKDACASFASLKDELLFENTARMPPTCPSDLVTTTAQPVVYADQPVRTAHSEPITSTDGYVSGASPPAGPSIRQSSTNPNKYFFVICIIMFLLAMAFCGEAKRRASQYVPDSDLALVEADDEDDEQRQHPAANASDATVPAAPDSQPAGRVGKSFSEPHKKAPAFLVPSEAGAVGKSASSKEPRKKKEISFVD